jgi:hypothetical protein
MMTSIGVAVDGNLGLGFFIFKHYRDANEIKIWVVFL